MREYQVPVESFLLPRRDGRAYCVLLCEDQEINQLMGVSNLENLGCLVDLAKDGQQAVRLATKKKYDIIFMDCNMPKLDGYQATIKIRKFEKATLGREYTPIVALTAKVMTHDREKCLEAGMDDYIPKPARRNTICDVINKWCSPESNVIFYKTEW